ncbi:MAG: ABC transporter permease [Syntrophus sp. SKADARSKE-3]|nr:ABC transporter permease [Syntrophus sp. SKADARSKE-3]
MTAFVEKIGLAAMAMTSSLRETLHFSFQVLVRMFSVNTYNSAVRMVLVNQIYFTSVQILPLVFVVSVSFGVIFIGFVGQYLRQLGLFEYFGHMLMGFVVTEFAPFITVLLIALRSGSAINTEIAVMKVNKELDTLEAFNINVITYLFIPRIVNGIISIVLLSSLFSIIVLLSGLFFSKFLFGLSMADYTTILVESASFLDILVMLLKCATLGFFIVLIPIRFGLSATNDLTSIPVAVLNGMVNVFIAIVIIEVLSLILISLIAKLL